MKLFDSTFTKEHLQETTHDALQAQHAQDLAQTIRNASYRGQNFVKVKDLRPAELAELEELGLFVELTAGKYFISWAN